MFTVHCPQHGASVLLGPDQITDLVSTPCGIELHWVCWCGEHGVEAIEREDAPC